MYLSHLKTVKKLRSTLITITFLPVFILCIIVIPVWGATGDYNGTFSGTFSGDDNGYWIAFVADTLVNFYHWSTTNTYPDVDLDMSIDGDGNFSGTSDINGTNISGTIDNGAISGTYTNAGSGDSGTLEGGVESEPSPFAGTYSGTFSGDFTGSWDMTISADGSVVTTARGSSAKGGVDSEGRVITFSNFGTGGFGTILDDIFSGTWVNTDNGDSGTSIGRLNDTDGGGGGGGGGGGCFIDTLDQ